MYNIRYTILHTFKTLKFKFAQVDTRIMERLSAPNITTGGLVFNFPVLFTTL